MGAYDDILAGKGGTYDDILNPQPPKQTRPDQAAVDMVKNGLAGLARGAGSIGATALSGLQYLGIPQTVAAGIDYAAGNGNSNAANLAHSVADSLRMQGADRRTAMDEGLRTLGADPNSLAYKGGKLGGEIAGTAGVGSALANGARLVGAAPKVVAALESGGFSLGNAAPAATLGQAAVNAGTRVLGGAANGAISAGMINPDDAKTGAIVGGVLPPAIKVSGEIGGGLKALLYDPLFNQNKIISNSLLRAIGPDNVNSVLSAINATPKTPGVTYSAGTATMNPALNAIEDALRSKNAAGALSMQQTANNLALATPMRNLAQDQAAVDAAKVARTQATNPLYAQAQKSDALADPTRVVNLIDRITAAQPANDTLVSSLNRIRNGLFQPYQAADRATDALASLQQVAGSRMSSADADAVRQASTIMRRVKMGTVAPDEAVQAINGLSTSSKTAGDALDLAAQYMKTPDYVLRQNPGQLMSAIDNIKGMLGSQENAHIRDELNTIKRALGHQINKAAPEFGQAEQTFAQMSQPINQMQIGQLLSNKLIPAGSGDIPVGLNAGDLAKALRNPDQIAKTATGFKRARFDNIMTPEQAAMVNGVSTDASRLAQARALGNGYGSATDRRRSIGDFLENNLQDTAPTISALFNAAGNVPGLKMLTKGASGAGSLISGKINKNMATTLEDMLASDPQAVADALRQAAKSGKPINPMLRDLLKQVPVVYSAQ